MKRPELVESVYAEVSVDIFVHPDAPANVLSRMWEDEELYNSLYGKMDMQETLKHLAFNCISNGVEDAKRLDGWADLESGMLTMYVSDVW